MSLRPGLLIALSITLLGSTAASAVPVTVTSYEMNNGNGLIQNGNYNYFDSTYSVPTNANTNGSSLVVPSNGAAKEAWLTGGTGKLTDNTIPSQNYSFVPQNYVGWKYQDPTIIFHLEAGKSVSSITLYVASSYASTLGFGGLVGQPASVGVSITTAGNTTFTPTYTTTFTDYLNNPYTGTEVITLAFASPILSSDTFSLTLNRGSLLLDGINYYNNHVVGYGCDAPATNCFLDNVNDFKNSAYIPNLQPWILLSEVQFTAAVPEPSTWIMMLLGFAGLGFGMYRRQAGCMPAAA
ncbi:hypothetical protein ACH79_43320 [Bradyrhizobium sp. CCBAU 051011]|uniref:PEP-CTERM sorting domain-containing protein n=1 Tax=Bradyrhizobium sp. CCBAU 051011 TaxID=858422 RepID=UPI00137431AA|nr:PEP-CTERM sorting domain-containing protein [Bradyrhizobium sp. CCBAU 051011]QHO78407.1 hypothetical protein ACH79_43320 [Bradyrhizobium sp. CCBAU 051011]